MRQNELLLNINKTKQLEKIYQKNKIKNSGLKTNLFISTRKVEKELINELYKINSVELNKTRDIRYGNGRC